MSNAGKIAIVLLLLVAVIGVLAAKQMNRAGSDPPPPPDAPEVAAQAPTTPAETASTEAAETATATVHDTPGSTSTKTSGASGASGGRGAAVATQAPKQLPQLMDFGAETCAACKALAPIIDQLETDLAGQLDVRFINVRKDPGLAGMFQIRVIPTLLFLDSDGNEISRREGYASRQKILAKWQELGYDFKLPPADTPEN